MSHILVIQNASNHEVLTWNPALSSVTSHEYINRANNFYVKLLGPTDQYHIERYNNPSDKLQPANGGSEVCEQTIPVSRTETVWIAERGSTGDSQSGIKLFNISSSGDKWYLRMPPIDSGANLVCSDQEYDEEELKFDLIAVDVTTII